MQQVATNLSPSFKVVVKYFISAIASFLILTFLMMINYNEFYGHHFQPLFLGLMHIATLGFISMVIFGAMFQLVPVILEVRLFSEALADIQFWIYLFSVAGFITTLWQFNTGHLMIVSASFVTLAILIFIFNISITLFKVKNWNITATYISFGLIYLFTTIILGLLLVINLTYPIFNNHLEILKVHAHLGFLGWITFIIMGVTYKLIPMFSLSYGYSLLASKIALIFTNIGLIGISFFISFEIYSFLFYLFVVCIAIGIMSFLYQFYLLMKKRVRKNLDIGLKFTVTSFSILIFLLLIGLFFGFIKFSDFNFERKFIIVYGFVIIIGFISFLVIGQMYKIVSFLVWFNKFSSKAGSEKVPMLKDMFSEKMAKYGYFIYLSGFVVSLFGLIFNLSFILAFSFGMIFLSAFIFLFNMIKIFNAKA